MRKRIMAFALALLLALSHLSCAGAEGMPYDPDAPLAALRMGDKGAGVLLLQCALKQQGYFEQAVSGLYDAGTKTAVLAFEQASGIAQDGVADEQMQRLLLSGYDAALAEPLPECVYMSRTGSCYHKKESCSNMKSPWYVTLDAAVGEGRRACKKCCGK